MKVKLPILMASILSIQTLTASAAFKAGAARVNINPPNGTPLAGYYAERLSQGVADDLFAKALVLDDGLTRVALVTCDLISLPRHVVEETRKLVQKQTGIPVSHVMIAATHTHTGPMLEQKQPVDQLRGGTNALCREYTAALPSRIAQAVADANAQRAPAQLSFGRAEEHQLAFNRRFWMKDGTVGWNPGKLNPDIVRPAGPINPEVGILFVESTDKKPLATFVNFAMHADTTGGTLVSADFPGALSRCLAAVKGSEMLTLFGNGPCGNINHFNVASAAPQTSVSEANRLGTILAAAVCKAYMELQPITNTALRVGSEIVRLPLAPITDEDVRAAKVSVSEKLQFDGAKSSATRTAAANMKFLDRVHMVKVLDVHARRGKPLEAEVQVIALGDALAWVALPGEIFVELGLAIKASSPFRQTQVVELANDSLGYIPNRAAYAEGNYEPVSARCAAGSGEQLVEVATKLLKELH